MSDIPTVPASSWPTLVDLSNQVRAARSTVVLLTRATEQLVLFRSPTEPPAMLPAEAVCLLLQQVEQLLDVAEATAQELEHQHSEPQPL